MMRNTDEQETPAPSSQVGASVDTWNTATQIQQLYSSPHESIIIKGKYKSHLFQRHKILVTRVCHLLLNLGRHLFISSDRWPMRLLGYYLICIKYIKVRFGDDCTEEKERVVSFQKKKNTIFQTLQTCLFLRLLLRSNTAWIERKRFLGFQVQHMPVW